MKQDIQSAEVSVFFSLKAFQGIEAKNKGQVYLVLTKKKEIGYELTRLSLGTKTRIFMWH